MQSTALQFHKVAFTLKMLIFGVLMGQCWFLPVIAFHAPASDAPDSLATRQSQVDQQVDRLRAQMLRLLRMIEEREPAQAEKLRDALRKDGEADIDLRFQNLIKLLSSAEFADASHTQDALIADLREMLQLLQDSDSALDRLREEREAIARARKSIENISAAQLQALQQTGTLREQLKIAQELRAQAGELERLADEQRALREGSANDDAKSDKQGTQVKLAEEAGQAGKKLQQSADDSSDDRIRRARRDAAHDVARAADEMRQAAQSAAEDDGNAEQGDAANATKKQQMEEAEARIRRAIRRLQEEASRVEKNAGTRAAESQQREIYREADELQRDVESSAQSGMPPNVAPALDKAGKQMRQAADRLGERDLEQAGENQNDALQALQESLDTLDEVLRQIREEEMEETLGALAARLRDLLEKEEKFRDEVLPYRAREDGFNREDQIALTKLADVQQGIIESASAVHRIFVDEGTTVVLPQLLDTIIEDMRAIERATREAKVNDRAIQHLEAAIEGLREILAAIEQQQQKNQERAEQSQEGQPQQSGQEALLPGSAELKLLKSTQLRINTLTLQLADEEGVDGDRYQAAAQRQQRLIEMARRLHERQ